MYLSIIAYVQAIVNSSLDIRWSLEKNINRVIPLELVGDVVSAWAKLGRIAVLNEGLHAV